MRCCGRLQIPRLAEGATSAELLEFGLERFVALLGESVRKPFVCLVDLPGAHASVPVQLMSARAPVQITTANEYEPGVPGGDGMGSVFRRCRPVWAQDAHVGPATTYWTRGTTLWATRTTRQTQRKLSKMRSGRGREASWRAWARPTIPI